MSARDIYHYQVRRALEKASWTVTHDPYFLKLEGVNFPVDLAAEKMIAAQKSGRKILVEIKSFAVESIPNEFHTALGQYLDYALGLEEQEPDRVIYLAIPERVYLKIEKVPFLVKALVRYKVNVLVFNSNTEKVTQWIQN